MRVFYFLISFLVSTNCASALDISNYNYPNLNAFQATVTFGVLQGPEGQRVYVGKNKGKVLPENYRGIYRYRYQLYAHRRRAPFVFVLAGLGGDETAGAAQFLARDLFAQGYHVGVLGSSFSKEFAALVARKPYVGLTQSDAADMYKVLVNIKDDLFRGGLDVSDWGLAGYSLGALTAGNIAKIDKSEREFAFRRVVLINPPVDLLYALGKLDNFFRIYDDITALEALSLGETWGDAKKRYRGSAINFRTVRSFVNGLGFTNKNIKAILGRVFRSPLTEVISNSQVVSPMRGLDNVSLEDLGYRDYVTRILERYYSFTTEGRNIWTAYHRGRFSIAKLNQSSSMYSLKSFLSQESNVTVFHNRDDFLLRAQDLRFLEDALGDRAVIYPRGGHVGNLWHPLNRTLFLAQFKSVF